MILFYSYLILLIWNVLLKSWPKIGLSLLKYIGDCYLEDGRPGDFQYDHQMNLLDLQDL